ncbi:MAG TPA: hypothetical protein VFV55_03605 [Usitatibacteraceae bacterium]|nr:hypothetical protein [Usitatibacteraceae bacterium]
MRQLLAASLLGPAVALAAPGDFDRSFGQDGVATLGPGPVADQADSAVFVDSDGQGRLLVIGSVLQPTNGVDVSVRLFARFLPEGIPDATLSGTGYIHTAPDPSTNRVGLRAYAVANGRTLLVEQHRFICQPSRQPCGLPVDVPHFFAQRIEPGGEIDSSYGVMATVSMDVVQEDVAVSPDGSLTVAGYQYPPAIPGAFPDPRFDVRGVDPAGQLFLPWFGARPSFDCGGDARPAARSAKMARQPDGRFLFVQQVSDAAGNNRLCVSRLNPDATLDTSFGSAGRLRVDDPRFAGGPATILALLARSAGGAILFLKPFGLGGSPLYMAWLTADGALDASRGVQGIVGPFAGPIDDFQTIALQPDDGILLAGFPLPRLAQAKVIPPIPDFGQPRIVRLDSFGMLDPGFGPTGEGYAPLVSSGRGIWPRHLHVGSDGAIFVAGSIGVGNLALAAAQSRFAVAKLEGGARHESRGGIWGSGCGSTRNAPVDPTLPALTLLAAALLLARSRKSR